MLHDEIFGAKKKTRRPNNERLVEKRRKLTTGCRVPATRSPSAVGYFVNCSPTSFGSVFFKRNRKPPLPFIVTVPSIFCPS